MLPFIDHMLLPYLALLKEYWSTESAFGVDVLS